MMLDQNIIDDLKADAEALLNASKMLYNLTQEMTANESDKDIAKKIVSVEGYLELVKNSRRDVNRTRKMIAQELNVANGIGE